MTEEAIIEATVFLQDSTIHLIREIIAEMAEIGPDGKSRILGGDIGGIKDKFDRIILIGDIGNILQFATGDNPEEI